jgi:hypothetical protein
MRCPLWDKFYWIEAWGALSKTIVRTKLTDGERAQSISPCFLSLRTKPWFAPRSSRMHGSAWRGDRAALSSRSETDSYLALDPTDQAPDIAVLHCLSVRQVAGGSRARYQPPVVSVVMSIRENQGAGPVVGHG